MREVVVDLKRYQKAKPAEVVVKDTGRWKIAITAAAVLAISALLSTWLRQESGSSWVNPLANAVFTRFTDWDSSERDAAISPDGKFIAFLSDRDGIFDAWVSQIGSGTFLNLTKGRFPALLHESIPVIGFSGDGAHVWLSIKVLNSKGTQISGDMWITPTMGGTARPFSPRRGSLLVA